MEAEVTGVDLSKNYLDKFPPQLEPLMKQLYELNLSSNRLTVLTPSIIGFALSCSNISRLILESILRAKLSKFNIALASPPLD